MNKKKENIIAAIIGFIFLTGVVCLFHYGIKMRDQEIPNQERTVCVYVKNSFAARGSSSIFMYYVDGKQYELITSISQMNLVLGQRYMLIYNRLKPEEAEVLIDEPVFTKNQKTEKTFAIITNLQTGVFYSEIKDVMFTYNVGNFKYETYQFADWKKYNVQVGDTYELE